MPYWYTDLFLGQGLQQICSTTNSHRGYVRLTETSHTILVVDDDESFRFLMAQRLTQSGYTVTTAANGAHAVQIIQAGNQFSLILCDLKMPLQDGVEFVKHLKDGNIQTPVIIITGYPSREKIIAVARSGITEILLKPIKGADLIKSIRLRLGQDKALLPT